MRKLVEAYKPFDQTRLREKINQIMDFEEDVTSS
jgi:hypothetical protein